MVKISMDVVEIGQNSFTRPWDLVRLPVEVVGIGHSFCGIGEIN